MKKYVVMFLLSVICTAQYTYAQDDNSQGQQENYQQNIERPSCTNSGLTQGIVGYKVVNGDRVYVRRMATILNPSLDDYGATTSEDELEVFCVSKKSADFYGILVMCLSGEACPWR